MPIGLRHPANHLVAGSICCTEISKANKRLIHTTIIFRYVRRTRHRSDINPTAVKLSGKCLEVQNEGDFW